MTSAFATSGSLDLTPGFKISVILERTLFENDAPRARILPSNAEDLVGSRRDRKQGPECLNGRNNRF